MHRSPRSFRLLRVLGLGVLLSLWGCAQPDAAPPVESGASAPQEEASAPQEGSVAIKTPYQGRISIGLSIAGAGPSLEPSVVRTQADHDAFVGSIPTHEIQKTNPAPPSDDPLLRKPAIDFAQDMLIVARRDSMYRAPEIRAVRTRGDELVVEVVHPPLGDSLRMAAQSGIGTCG